MAVDGSRSGDGGWQRGGGIHGCIWRAGVDQGHMSLFGYEKNCVSCLCHGDFMQTYSRLNSIGQRFTWERVEGRNLFGLGKIPCCESLLTWFERGGGVVGGAVGFPLV